MINKLSPSKPMKKNCKLKKNKFKNSWKPQKAYASNSSAPKKTKKSKNIKRGQKISFKSSKV